jgi:hypothetical protein
MTGGMIELIGVPILMKAVDFLFGLAKDRVSKSKSNKPDEAPNNNSHIELEHSLEEVHHWQVDTALLQMYQVEIAAVLDQLEIHQRNLNLAHQQKAKWGETLVPPIIEHNIRDEQAAIGMKVSRLTELLEQVTNRPLPKPLDQEL